MGAFGFHRTWRTSRPRTKTAGALAGNDTNFWIVPVSSNETGTGTYNIRASRPPRTSVPGSAPVNAPLSNVTSPDFTV